MAAIFTNITEWFVSSSLPLFPFFFILFL
jgi:hypothetical protein